MLSLIIPANNEADYIGACLQSVLASEPSEQPFQIIVAANGCSDNTVQIAQGFAAAFAGMGWVLIVLDIAKPGKLNAMNIAEAVSLPGANRAFLDADVRVDPSVLAQIDRILNRPEPAYASGRPRVAKAKSWFTRAYARIWTRLPFMQFGVPGCGLFAINPAGRSRWGALPDIISDDTFVRLNFSPAERHGVSGGFEWPMVEGFKNLKKVRRRQDIGVQQVAERFPGLLKNDEMRTVGSLRVVTLFVTDPIGFAVYAFVSLAVRIQPRTPTPKGETWVRGR